MVKTQTHKNEFKENSFWEQLHTTKENKSKGKLDFMFGDHLKSNYDVETIAYKHSVTL